MEIINPVSIEKNAAKDPALDFAFLRQEGIDLLQKLSGKVWTDFNVHDPGLTILEQLCFAITDLAYRTDFPIEDILANSKGEIDLRRNGFFIKEKILTTNPITVNDFRKIILDEVSELSNVILIPVKSKFASDYIKGLYRIKIQVKPEIAEKIRLDRTVEDDIKKRVISCFLDHRNLCEDMIKQVMVLKPQELHIHAEIIVSEQGNAEEILATIYDRLESLLNPPIKRYSEKELLDRGLTRDEIFSGPILKRGFIPDNELKPVKREIDPTTIIELISKVEGVIYVKKLWVYTDKKSYVNKPFRLRANHFPLLNVNRSLKEMQLLTNAYKLTIDEKRFEAYLKKLQEMSDSKLKAAVSKPGEKDRKGTYRNIENYNSIQSYFPVTYGIGINTLSVNETDERKAQAKQLKAYLMFFEQVLINYLAQLANVSSFFAADRDAVEPFTYYFQALYNVPGAEDILRAFTKGNTDTDKKKAWQDFINDTDNAYIQSLRTSQESTTEYRERKNAVLDHMLARFNERLSTYPVTLYNTIYKSNSKDQGRIDDILKWKTEIMWNLVKMNHSRVRAFNYTRGIKNTSGFEKKIAALLFLQNNRNRPLTRGIDGIFNLEENEKKVPVPNAGLPEEVDWDENGQKIIADPAEGVQSYIIERASKHENYIFRNETTKVFKDGINRDNYRVGKVEGEDNYQVIYVVSPPKYKVVSIHPNKYKAEEALDKLIEYLKTLSIESEGFHLVEHILLRPGIESKSFGYRFLEDSNTVMFENSSWTNFSDRKKTLTKFLKIVTGKMTQNNGTPAFSKPGKEGIKLTSVLPGRELLLHDIYNKNLKPEEIQQMHEVENKLLAFQNKKMRPFPCFEMLVKLPNNKIIKEDFFNSQITVVFPTWPARFQDEDFRSFAEDLFILNAPIHLRFNFIWLGVSQMKHFEKLYFDWLDWFKTDFSHEIPNEIADQLIEFLNPTPKK